MKQKTYILLILILTSCCDRYAVYRFSDIAQEKQVYSLINDILIDSIYKPDLITLEAMGRFVPGFDKDDLKPPGYYYSYDDLLFDSLVTLRLIDSVEVTFLKQQMKKPLRLNWDPKQLKVSTCNRDTIFKKVLEETHTENYAKLEQDLKASNFLSISIPLISRNNNIIIVSTIFFCGWTCGEGVEYVFQKTDGKWKIVYSKQMFVS